MRLPATPTILVDTREQLPFTFRAIEWTPPRSKERLTMDIPTRRATIPEDGGDYMVEGVSDVAIERKSLQDLYGTIGQNRAGFARQVRHMHTWLRFAAIVIEAGWDEIREPAAADDCWRSEMNPHAMWGTIWSWQQRYPRVHWIAAGSRRNAELICFEILEKAWRETVRA